jgi:hypothetical protein
MGQLFEMQLIDKPDLDQAGTQILHPGSRSLFRHWEAIRAERPCPSRQDIDLQQIIPIIPDLMIIEKNIMKTGWQYRLAGTRLCEIMNGELTGRDALGGWDSFERNVVSKSLDITLNRLQPCLVRMRFISDRGNVLAAEMIALPILDRNNETVQIIGGIFPFAKHSSFTNDPMMRRELVSARMIWTEHEQGDALLTITGRKAPAALRVIQGGRV